MRRLVVLIVLALLGAGLYGWSTSTSAVSVNGTGVSNSTFLAELSAIATTPALQCYLDALSHTSLGPGAGADTVTTSTAATWANLRIEGISVDNYVKSTFHYTPSAKALAQAETSLEGELTEAASSAQYTCPSSAAQALAAMPAEMRRAEVREQATSTFLVSKLDTTIPLTAASIKTYYSNHVSQYDTICVSIALVSPAQLSAFSAAQSQGESVAALAEKFSQDPSAKQGGAYGCYGPTSSSFDSVRADVASTKLNDFSSTPQYINDNGSEMALYVAPTKETVTPFAQAESAVISDIQSLNSTQAASLEENILEAAAVGVNSAFGRWGETSSTSGPSVFVPALPSSTDALDSSANLTTASASKYK
ncbi:MAG: hypothetical protein WAN30_05865 [Acidimicrobiales bacterium]